MEQIRVTLKYAKETPGTYQFVNEDKDAVITAIYVKKAAFGEGKPPKKIKLLVKDAIAS